MSIRAQSLREYYQFSLRFETFSIEFHYIQEFHIKLCVVFHKSFQVSSMAFTAADSS